MQPSSAAAVLHTQISNASLWSPHITGPHTFMVHFSLGGRGAGLSSGQFQRKEARNGDSSKGAAGEGKELDRRLGIAGSGAKGEKGRGNG